MSGRGFTGEIDYLGIIIKHIKYLHTTTLVRDKGKSLEGNLPLVSLFRIWFSLELGFIVSDIGISPFVGSSRFFEHIDAKNRLPHTEELMHAHIRNL